MADPIIEVPSGLNVNKQGGDAFGVSGALSGAFGEAEQCGGGGSYYGGGGSSANAGGMMGAGSIAAAGDSFAVGGDGGKDQTSIGDITINT